MTWFCYPDPVPLPEFSVRRTILPLSLAGYCYQLRQACRRLRDLVQSETDPERHAALKLESEAVTAAYRVARRYYQDKNWAGTCRIPPGVLRRAKIVAGIVRPGALRPRGYPAGCWMYPWYELEVGDSVRVEHTPQVVFSAVNSYLVSIDRKAEFYCASDGPKAAYVWRTG